MYSHLKGNIPLASRVKVEEMVGEERERVQGTRRQVEKECSQAVGEVDEIVNGLRAVKKLF